MVVQFVAFLGAYRAPPGGLDPWTSAVIGSLLTTWVTFVPCFLFVLIGAPYVERLRHSRALSAALTTITAAVVGVIANLGAYFAVHTFWSQTRLVDQGPIHVDVPVLGSLQPAEVLIALLAAWLLFRRRWSVLRTLGVCAVIGLGVQGLQML